MSVRHRWGTQLFPTPAAAGPHYPHLVWVLPRATPNRWIGRRWHSLAPAVANPIALSDGPKITGRHPRLLIQAVPLSPKKK